MLRAIFKNNLNYAQKHYANIDYNDFETRGLIDRNEPTPDLIEEIKTGRKIAIILKKDNNNYHYTLAYVDKDGDYQKRAITDEAIIKDLNVYVSAPNALKMISTNPITPHLVTNINTSLKTLDSKFSIEERTCGLLGAGLPVMPAGALMSLVIVCTGWIVKPVVAGVKSLFDWASRKRDIPQSQADLIAQTIAEMKDEKFALLSANITSHYKQRLINTTSCSSRVMIKQLNGQNTPQEDKHYNQAMLTNYMKDTKNNGKRLFCEVMKQVNNVDMAFPEQKKHGSTF